MPYNTILKPKASTNGSDYILRRVNLSTRYSEARSTKSPRPSKTIYVYFSHEWLLGLQIL